MGVFGCVSRQSSIIARGVIGAAALLLTTLCNAELVIIDVRTPQEFSSSHVEGALNIPYENILQGVADHNIKKDDEVVLYCRSGRRAGVAMNALKDAGFEQLINTETETGTRFYLQGKAPTKL